MAFDLPRRVEPELLDQLEPADPRAKRTRGDLRRINRILAALRIVRDALDRIAAATEPPTAILELGAGDGSLMLRLAKQRKAQWPKVAVTLLDRQKSVDALTLAGIRSTGWEPDVLTMDVVDWLAEPPSRKWDVVIANLFVHHFADEALRNLFAGITQRSDAFFCCEPRRTQFAVVASHFVGVVGAGPVTRSDAVASVHAGFRGNELSALWPDREHWDLREFECGMFSHCFAAVRKKR